ncbi:MAG: hypothetical protein HKL88_05905 [Bacteroidia bacterium]|nr:hypothetical protein [Bacteroidia bacterium]
MLFITFNDSPYGIYRSQVTDVCLYLQDRLEINTELVAFVSLRNYLKDRREIKNTYPHSTVLPLFPGIGNWRTNGVTLKLFMMFRKRQAAIARGVFATHLALDCKRIQSVTYDARGAYSAEWKEYMRGESDEIVKEITTLEKEALFKSDFRIAVSEQLVQYWRTGFGYKGTNHAVIPCTLDSRRKQPQKTEGLRKELGVNDDDILLVFSGSAAAWQSMEHLYSILLQAFSENSALKLLLLTKDKTGSEFLTKFSGRIYKLWVEPEQVPSYLKAADYGLLYRENTVTNRVSSPVKFAQYLDAGLPVIISEHVGDYSTFTLEKKCGMLFSAIDWKAIRRPAAAEKVRMTRIAAEYFSKDAYMALYKKLAETDKGVV